MHSKPRFIAQERPDTCALACLRMILTCYGKRPSSEATLLRQISLSEGGANPEQLVHLAEQQGLKAEAKPLDLIAIQALVARERYPIVYVDRSLLDNEFSVHAVIPIRFRKHFVTVLDPLRGSRRLSSRKFEIALTRVGWSVICYV